MPVYMIRAGETGPVKIGHSNDPIGRLVELQVGHYEKLRIIRLFDGGEAEEATLHVRFADLHIRGEWHAFSRLMLGDVGLAEVIPITPDLPTSIADVSTIAVFDISVATASMGARLRSLRKSRGYTQESAAVRLGIARATLAKIETGDDLPGRDVILRASKLFGVPLFDETPMVSV